MYIGLLYRVRCIRYIKVRDSLYSTVTNIFCFVGCVLFTPCVLCRVWHSAGLLPDGVGRTKKVFLLYDVEYKCGIIFSNFYDIRYS